jgi:hypothetical protein
MAGALRACGIPFGKREMAPTAHNPKGYVEIPMVAAIHDLLFTQLASSWNDPLPIADNWWSLAPTFKAATALTELIKDEFSPDSSIIGIKDPRICRLLPLWEKVARNLGRYPNTVFMLRPPGEVAASIHEFHPNFGSKGTFLKVWKLCAREYMKHRHLCPGVVVEFSKLLSNPEDTIQETLEELLILAPFDLSAATKWIEHSLPTKRTGPTDEEAESLFNQLRGG